MFKTLTVANPCDDVEMGTLTCDWWACKDIFGKLKFLTAWNLLLPHRPAAILLDISPDVGKLHFHTEVQVYFSSFVDILKVSDQP